MTIVPVSKSDHPRLVEIWEASVRATHDFLTELEVQTLRPLIEFEFFPTLELTGVRDQADELVGFVGTLDRKIEMLFVAPEAMRKGAGRRLVDHAVGRLGCDSVDVNEQNPNARAFYERMGFRVVGRSDRDGQGNAFPLIHLRLNADHSP